MSLFDLQTLTFWQLKNAPKIAEIVTVAISSVTVKERHFRLVPHRLSLSSALNSNVALKI